MKPSISKTMPIAATILALTLSACGGGGGGSDNKDDDGVSGVSLGGSAVKGIIKGGNVVATELDSSGNSLRQVGSATTEADGSYSLTVDSSYQGGPIQVMITAGADTEMKCDVPTGCGDHASGSTTDTNTNGTIDFGEWYKPASLTMTALVAEAAANDTIGVNITPYTDLAARRAKQGSLSASAVYNANSEVSHLLGGIDILNTQPLDITDTTAVNDGSATQVAYAAFAAAIASLADTTGGNPDIDGALNTLADSFSDGTILADDSGMNDSVISLQEIIDGAESTLSQTGTVDTSGVIVALQDDVTNASGGSVDPEPSSTAGSTTLSKVKAFVTDVRTWGTVIESETTASANAFDTQASLASDAADMSLEFLVGPALEASLNAIINYFSGTATGNDLSTYGLGFTSGSISDTSGTITITDAVIGDTTVNMTVEFPQQGNTATSFLIGITSATFRSNAADTDINSATITITTATNYTVDTGVLGTGTLPDISGGSMDFDLSITQKQDTMGVDLNNAITFSGGLAVTLTNPIKDANGDFTWITPSTMSQTGSVSSTAGHSLDYTLTANVTNANSFEPVGSLPEGTVKNDIITWSYSDNDSNPGNDTFVIMSPELDLTIAWDSNSGIATVTEDWGYGYSYNYEASGTYAGIVEAVSTLYTPLNWYMLFAGGDNVWVDGEGDYYVDTSNANYSQDGSANGILVDPDFVIEGTGNGEWLDADLGLSFTLQLSGLPEASVSITGDRTGYESATATITIAYGNRQIVMEGNFTNTSSTGSMTITNQDGVSMVLTGDLDTGSGTLTYNGQTYGTIEQLSNGLTKISYTDGTFETL